MPDSVAKKAQNACMSKTEKIVMKLFKESLSKKGEISDKLIDSLILELGKEKPNVERLAGIIRLKKEYLSND